MKIANYATSVGMSICVCAASIAIYHWSFSRKIAYVESNKLISNFTVAAQARKQFESEQGQWQAELKALEDSLSAAMEALKAGYDKADKGRKTELAKRLEKWNSDYARYSRAMQEKSVAREQELMQPAVDKINKFMEIWGKKHGYDIVFGTLAGGNIVHANRALDVTDRVIRDIDDYYKD